MSFQPPRTDGTRSVPGYLIVLAALSVLLLLFSLGVGLIAFGVIDIDGPDDPTPPPVGVEGQAMQFSGFTVHESRVTDGQREIDVNVAVTNTGNEALSNTWVLVQCTDGGNVSSSKLIPSIQPDQTLRLEFTLGGNGDPKCADPQVSFDSN